MNPTLEYTLDRVKDEVARYDKWTDSEQRQKSINQLKKLGRYIAKEVIAGGPLSDAHNTVNKFLSGPGRVLGGDGQRRPRPNPYTILSDAFWKEAKKVGRM